MPSRFGIGAELAFIFAIFVAVYALHLHTANNSLKHAADIRWGAMR